MSTLSQIGRGAVLLTSMALVACYINVYATGKFPWQHTAAETPATVPPPDYSHDSTMYVAEQAGPAVPVFLPGSKSDVAASAVVVQAPTANAQTTTGTPATPLFLSGSKSFTGQTTVLSGALNTPPANPLADQKAPAFMGGSKTIMLPTRLPETLTPTATPAVSLEKMQFMSGFKSPGPAVMPGATIPAPLQIMPASQAQGYPATIPQQGIPSASAKPMNSANQNPLFMSGAKSPIREVPKQSLFDNPVPASNNPSPQANAPNLTPQFMSGSKSPFGRVPTPQQTAPPPVQQQMTPSKTTPRNAPYSPAGSY